jgi:hypothetical protein
MRRLDPHARYRELLAARLDRALTRAENRLLVGHLKSCADCRRAERDYRDQGALLRALPKPEPPRDLWARTSTALDREVSRWSYRYPRFGRQPIVRDRRGRPGTPNALATVVAAVGVVTVLAVMQLAPALRPIPSSASSDGNLSIPASIRPTPFSVSPQSLAFVAGGMSDLSIYQTQVNQVCPTTAPTCFDDKSITKRRINLPANMHAQNAALSPSGNQMAVVGRGTRQDVIAVVMLLSDRPAQPTDTPPTDQPRPTASSASGGAQTPTPEANSSPDTSPTVTDPPVDSSADPGASDHPATPNTGEPEPTPSNEGTETASPAVSVEPSPVAPESPPASVIPGLTVLSILEDVHSAGAPPAWSRDGGVLAFSAMPADGSHGPDVYVWQPGDDQARAVTTDHASFFASWSGKRIVASRTNQTPGKSDSIEIITVVIDPETLEERRVSGPEMWLPVVDPQRDHAVAWHGELDVTGSLPTVLAGELYLVDWSAIDPYGTAVDGTDNPDEPDTQLVPVDASRDASTDPVLDWHARWSTNGRVLGIWEAASQGDSWGTLRVLAFDPDSAVLKTDEPLIGPVFAKRGFTLGEDRVAWVQAPTDGTQGELHVRTWGTDGVGDLRIESITLEELVPAF